MNNKLQEAGDKVRKRIWDLSDEEIRLSYDDLDMIEETVREVCVEYARSIIPVGFDPCIDEANNRINQDLQSLNQE